MANMSFSIPPFNLEAQKAFYLNASQQFEELQNCAEDESSNKLDSDNIILENDKKKPILKNKLERLSPNTTSLKLKKKKVIARLFDDLKGLSVPCYIEFTQASREFYNKLGTYIGTWSIKGAYAFHIYKRKFAESNEDSMLYITEGLSKPSEFSDVGLGVEIALETRKKELDANKKLDTFLYTMLIRITDELNAVGLQLRSSIEANECIFREYYFNRAPPFYIDLQTSRCGVLLGIKSPGIPASFSIPSGQKILIVTAKILTVRESATIKNFGEEAIKEIVNQNIKNKTYHLTTFVEPEAFQESDVKLEMELSRKLCSANEAISEKVILTDFAAPSPLKDAMEALGLTAFANTLSEIFGTLHFEAYLQNPELYLRSPIEALKATEKCSLIGEPLTLYDLSIAGENLVKQMINIIDNALKKNKLLNIVYNALKKDKTKQLGIEACAKELQSLGTDFVKKSRETLSELPKTFPREYVEFSKIPATWPHSQTVLRAIESAGFVYSPKTIYLDRCICKICNVEVWGWLSWDTPWRKHDFTKHPPSFAAQFK